MLASLPPRPSVVRFAAASSLAFPFRSMASTGMVNIAEPVMFKLKGDEDTTEAQQSTKGVGNLLNKNTLSTLRHLRNKLSRFVPNLELGYNCTSFLSRATWAAEPRAVQLVWCVVQSVCLARPSPERNLGIGRGACSLQERARVSTREHLSLQENTFSEAREADAEA